MTDVIFDICNWEVSKSTSRSVRSDTNANRKNLE